MDCQWMVIYSSKLVMSFCFLSDFHFEDRFIWLEINDILVYSYEKKI